MDAGDSDGDIEVLEPPQPEADEVAQSPVEATAMTEAVMA